MRVAVVGGKLQGIEACYLAHRAEWEVVLIDKNPLAPATGLCDDFFCHEIIREPRRLAAVIRHVDLVIPAIEDKKGLRCLAECAAREQIPLALDLEAYAVTSSKKRSNDLFYRLGLPAPRPWPDCAFPVIVKPAESSGSRGVTEIADPTALDVFFKENKTSLEQWVTQEYLEGPSYSLEVIGLAQQSVSVQSTGLEMDASFDCKRVVAPADLLPAEDEEFRAIAGTLAQEVHLKGIMDVEVVRHKGRLKVLEIDARLPSQTPAAVERSTGINMLELLRDVFLESRLPKVTLAERPCGVVYEHISVTGNYLEVSGEHIMAQAGPLHMEEDFFGADVALTDFSSRDRPWVATLIVGDASRERAWEKRGEVIRSIMEACKLSCYKDPVPDITDGLKGRPR